jgi:hypothetical protein
VTRLSEVLDEAVGAIVPAFDFDDITARVERRRRRRLRRVIVVSVAVVALVTTSAVIALRTGEGKHARVDVITPPAPLPSDVLVFDTTNGIMTVDYTRRVVAVHPLEGWRPGDQPFLSLHVGGSFVVGWEDVHATPLSSRTSVLLGRGVFVPAVEPGAVWLTSYGQVQTPTERLVDMRGRVLLEGRTPQSRYALTGAPGGLVLQGTVGLDIWDARTERITRHLGAGPAVAAPMHGSLLAWCDRCDRQLEITDLATGDTTSIAVQLDGGFLDLGRIGFSPDGSHFAVVAQPDAAAPPTVTSRVLVVDVATGRVERTLATQAQYASLAWSADSQRLYVTESGSGASGTIVRYDIATFAQDNLGAAPAGAGSFSTVLSGADAAQLPAVPQRPPSECRPGGTWIAPNGSGLACSYQF